LGLDSNNFSQCLESGKYTEVIEKDNELARQLGVQSTPTFVVNGTPLIGAQPFESFQQVIDIALSNVVGGNSQ